MYHLPSVSPFTSLFLSLASNSNDRAKAFSGLDLAHRSKIQGPLIRIATEPSYKRDEDKRYKLLM